ncbi:hypothetical protein Amet_2118 [Alkaliphilus metalliredigens QYMF]|uniref:Phage protein n=1 Tax=Alkaliphilus metalliredigens (strain QYMF) TaxID=293826 RepID=A6TQ09_ALKMQ|nr:hypothetical protein [Alkaliphilus metalliredigens]ABR48277.1 hypothetical protein Amet_2118 [Alkaliphilus metalliredigens QYMF]
MSQGWISLHRKIKEHAIYQETRKFSKFEAWVDILLRANHSEREFIVGYQKVKVNRGGLFTSIMGLGNQWGWSRKKTKKFLDYLHKEQMIAFKSTSKYTSIDILNYEKYQGVEDLESVNKDEKRTSDAHQQHINSTSDAHQKDINKTSMAHEKNTNNNVNNENNVNNVNNDKQKKTTSKEGYSQDFEAFWECYPRKIEKLRAYRCYKQRIKEGYTPLQLLRAVTAYSQKIKKEKTDLRYIKHCSTFLGRDKPFVDYLGGGKDHGINSKSIEEYRNTYDGIGFKL